MIFKIIVKVFINMMMLFFEFEKFWQYCWWKILLFTNILIQCWIFVFTFQCRFLYWNFRQTAVQKDRKLFIIFEINNDDFEKLFSFYSQNKQSLTLFTEPTRLSLTASMSIQNCESVVAFAVIIDCYFIHNANNHLHFSPSTKWKFFDNEKQHI